MEKMEDLKTARDLLKETPSLDRIDANVLLDAARRPFVLGVYDFFFLLGLAERLRSEYAGTHPGRSYPGYQNSCCIPSIWIAGGYDLRMFSEKGFGAVPLEDMKGVTALKAMEDVVRKELQHEVGLARGETMGVHYVLEAVDIIGELTKLGAAFEQVARKTVSSWRVLAQKLLNTCDNFLRHQAKRTMIRGTIPADQAAVLERQSREVVAAVGFQAHPQIFRKGGLFAPFLEGRPYEAEELEAVRRALEMEGDPYFHLRYGRLDYQGIFKEGYAE